MAFDPHEELGVPREASPAQVREAYRRRQRETDPERVRGMDPRVVRAAAQARERVETAFRLLSEPSKVTSADLERLAGEEGAEASAEDGPAPKSYLRAIFLTMLVPGTGSGYAGGRRRGLIAFAVFGIASVVLTLAGMRSLSALRAGGGSLMSRFGAFQEILGEMSGWFTSLMVLMVGDAVLATWAHNDALRSRARSREADGSTKPSPS